MHKIVLYTIIRTILVHMYPISFATFAGVPNIITNFHDSYQLFLI